MELKPIIELVLGLAIVGAILYVVERFIPMDEIFRTVIRIIVVIAVIYFLVRRFL